MTANSGSILTTAFFQTSFLYLKFNTTLIVEQKSINEAATAWGLKCLRYEISKLNANFFFLRYSKSFIFCKIIPEFFSCPEGDISPPPGVKAAMEMQAEAERRKRAQILESEGIIVFLGVSLFRI